MDIVVDQKQISQDERVQVTKQVRSDLVDHLYQGCLPGTLTGLVVSVLIYFDFYGYTPTRLLIIWLIAFDFMMIALSTVYFLYMKYKYLFSLVTWEWAYSITMVGCALVWVPIILLMPDDTMRQYLALMLLFLATTGYATGTIGQFSLGVVTLNILLIPLTIWGFYQGGVFYNSIGIYALIYMGFLIGINHRSTQWFKDSLKLKIENTLVSYQANHDLLTNLPNQRLLPQYVESAIKAVKSTGDTFALICFSLNRMEMINDSLGHAAGNAVIRAVSDRLNSFAASMKDESYFVTISRKDTFNILVLPFKLEDAENKIKALFSILDDPFYLEKS